MIHHLAAIVLAYILDLIVGDPPNWPHPVKFFGSVISFFDARWNKGKNRKATGIVMVMVVIMLVLSASVYLVFLFYRMHPLAGMALEAILISTTIAQKSLQEAAREVSGPLKNKNLHEARQKLSFIVGRDTENLPEQEIVRGTVETVAENTSDGVTAPLFWAFIGGAPLALMYRLVNTCDSMVGYQDGKYAEFGWASAKLDDVLNWIPARLTAFVMMFVMKPKKTTHKKAWSILLRDAKKHPSPNSGCVEAAVAALLGVQLGGINFYQGRKSHRMEMGDASVELGVNHILQAIAIMRRTVLLFLFMMVLGSVLIGMAFTWI